MKHKFLSVVTIAVLVASCYKKLEQPIEVPVTKTVQISIAQGNDYSSSIHDGLKVELKLSVAKESTVDGKILAAWDTTFSLRSIRDYAASTNPLVISKQFNGVSQIKQLLRVSWVIKYVNAANQISQNAVGENIPAFMDVRQVVVSL